MNDDRFGAVVVEIHDDGAVIQVSGDSIPTGSIARHGVRTRTDCAIGTRSRDRLRLEIDGREFDIAPGSGGFTRRSYRVVASEGDRSWLFTPATPTAHRLVAGTRYRGGNEIGMFTADDGHVHVEWSAQVRFAGITVSAVEPDATAASLGYLLAAAFGTGARLMGASVVANAVATVFPP